MKIVNVLAACAIVLSVAGAGKLDGIKSNSPIFKKHLIEIRNMEESIESASSGAEAAQMDKDFAWSTLPSAFSAVIAVDDEDGFAGMLEVMKRLNMDLTSFSTLSTTYNFAVDIVDHKAVKCLKLLKKTDFKFNEPIDDGRGHQWNSLLAYAKSSGADKEIIRILGGR